MRKLCKVRRLFLVGGMVWLTIGFQGCQVLEVNRPGFSEGSIS